jgi:hypothetical protein
MPEYWPAPLPHSRVRNLKLSVAIADWLTVRPAFDAAALSLLPAGPLLDLLQIVARCESVIIKCYQSLVKAIGQGKPWGQAALNKLLEQLLRHLRVSRHYGLQYRIIVSNAEFAAFRREQLGEGVDVIVREWEPCD